MDRKLAWKKGKRYRLYHHCGNMEDPRISHDAVTGGIEDGTGRIIRGVYGRWRECMEKIPECYIAADHTGNVGERSDEHY